MVTQSGAALQDYLKMEEVNTLTGQTVLIGNWPINGTGPLVMKETNDIVTPDFNRRMAQGEIINNPFDSYSCDIDGPGFSSIYHYSETNYPVVVQGRPYNYWKKVTGKQHYKGPSPYRLAVKPEACADMLDTVKDLAVTSAHAGVNQAEMQALATIAESRKTIDFFYNTLKRAFRIFKAVRKLDLRAAKGLISPKELEDMYMEYRYAIRPLIYDINDLTAALQIERAANVRQTSRGYAKDSESGQDVVGPIALVEGVTCYYTVDWSYHCSARAGVLCDIAVTADTTFGLTDVVETMWELLPFSFIADWFANIGETIAAWTPNMRADQLASWVTTREIFECSSQAGILTDSFTPDQYTVNHNYSITPVGYKGRETFLHRIVDPQLSVFPTLETRLDSLKILDLVIVLRSIMGLR